MAGDSAASEGWFPRARFSPLADSAAGNGLREAVVAVLAGSVVPAASISPVVSKPAGPVVEVQGCELRMLCASHSSSDDSVEELAYL